MSKRGSRKKYFRKWTGHGSSPPRVGFRTIFWSWLGSFLGIYAVAAITLRAGVPMMIGSFGASAVLIYAAIDSPLAQPRNLIGGHVISAILAVIIFQLLGKSDITLALAVSGAIVAMLVTGTLHPPGGATAFIAVDTMQNFTFVLYPVFLGAMILLLIALTVNNLSHDRHYPKYWR